MPPIADRQSKSLSPAEKAASNAGSCETGPIGGAIREAESLLLFARIRRSSVAGTTTRCTRASPIRGVLSVAP